MSQSHTALPTASSLPLPTDLVYRILVSLPDFACLKSVLLASNAFLSTFSMFQRTITHSIAYNEIGYALPQALKLIRAVSSSGVIDYSVSEDTWDQTPITPYEARSMAKNAVVARELEDIFSWRCCPFNFRHISWH